MSKLTSLVKYGVIGVTAGAVVQELMKPPEERRWHGKVAGFVPYDFRMPTLDRIIESYWNPEDPRIFTDRVLGVGWAVNFGRLVNIAKECCEQRRAEAREEEK